MDEILTGLLTDKKVRGFEFISTNQAMNDLSEFVYKDEVINLLLNRELKLPKRATKNSAGYDVFSPIDFTLQPGEEIKVPTLFKAYMQYSEFLGFFPRSGLGFKYYCRLANTVGVGDGDYYNNSGNEGHYWVKLRNESNVPMTVKRGEAMCQAIFIPFLLADGDSFENGEIRNGGFGSTTK